MVRFRRRPMLIDTSCVPFALVWQHRRNYGLLRISLLFHAQFFAVNGEPASSRRRVGHHTCNSAFTCHGFSLWSGLVIEPTVLYAR